MQGGSFEGSFQCFIYTILSLATSPWGTFVLGWLVTLQLSFKVGWAIIEQILLTAKIVCQWDLIL